MTEEVRWHYRFRNFSRAFSLLREALEEEAGTLNQLEREGVIQRFEYTFELAWNLLKDRLEHDGVSLPTVTPRQVIRQAFQAQLIQDGDAWVDMRPTVIECRIPMTLQHSISSLTESSGAISPFSENSTST